MPQKPFNGTVNVDLRDSSTDWTPLVAPRAPAGALEKQAVAMLARE